MAIEQTFILIKPDISDNKKIYNEILDFFHENNLTIINTAIIEMTEYKIASMWHRETIDLVCKRLMFKYLCGKKLPLIMLEGDNALQKGLLIKKYIRSKYATSNYANCLHTPNGNLEYLHDTSILYNKNKNFVPPVKENKSLLNKYGKKKLILCSTVLWSLFQNIRFENAYKALYEADVKWKLIILSDQNHRLYEVVEILSECLKLWSLEMIYYIILATDWLGEFPLIVSNDYKDIIGIKEYLDLKNLATRIDDEEKHIDNSLFKLEKKWNYTVKV